MPDTKITALAAITTVAPANDLFAIVDVSDNSMAASGTTKNITTNQILGAGGTATLASATITGDLTVRTNKLFVNSVGVGIGAAATSYQCEINSGASASTSQFKSTGASVISRFADGTGETGYIGSGISLMSGISRTDFGIASNGALVFGVSTGLAMTLNSAGLGVGQVPSTSKLEVGITNTSTAGLIEANSLKIENNNATVNNAAGLFLSQTGNAGCGIAAIATNRTGGSRTSELVLYYYNQASSASPIEGLRLNSSGNVGIGVTPSAWGGSNRAALQFPGGNAIQGSAAIGLASFNNCFNNGTNDICIANGTTYKHVVGTGYQWFIGTGTAGNSFSFGDAKMTLDASGNLLVGTTDTGSNSGIGIKSVYSATAPYVATVGSSTSASQYSYLLYSTGGTPAYKFYVSYSGQISATSGTVAALSDARFKENIQDIDVGLGAILALKPRKFDWKAGRGKDIKGDRGFIAQEFETVFPNLIDEWADPAPEGEAPYKSVRQDIIPVLVKAIQELAAEVNALKKA